MAALVVTCGLVLGACSDGKTLRETLSNKEIHYFDGFSFRAKASKADKADRALFQSTAKPVSQSLDGARQAAAYEATKYCIENFGTSRIRWTVGPETSAESLQIDNDTLTYQGRCKR